MTRKLQCATILALLAGTALGQTWIEDGDAPALLPGQTTVGTGAVTTIAGALTGNSDADLYAIEVTDYANFSASTVGGTTFDSTLFLFDVSGKGISMSEDAQGTSQSTITATFLTHNGLYYVAVTAYNNKPLNAAGLKIWNDTPWDVEREPDGPGAPGPLASWNNATSTTGTYQIFLTGAAFAQQGPPPQTGACCLPNYTCQVMSANACATAGGTYRGDHTACDPNPCPEPPTGACCFATHGCLKITEALCVANGGTYNGDQSVCWPNPCGGSPGQQWSDNFESYANGTVLYNVGGWSGWDNLPANAGTVSDVRARSAPHSIAVHNSDAIHPFSGYEGGQWIFTAWQYIPANLSGITYFILNSYYQHGGPYYWAVELHMDPATGKVNDSIRDPNATVTLPIVYDQWVQIRIEVDLRSGLGTVNEYYNNQLLMTGDWITGPIGQLAIGNVDLYAPHPETVYYDDLSLLPGGGGGELHPTRPLFVGVEYGDLPTRTSNLGGFPNVTWEDGFTFGVNGAAGRPDGTLYLTSGDFTTKLYLAPLEGPAVFLANCQNDVSGLAYGRGKLYGFANYASPMGIYEINPVSGAMTLAVSTAAQSYRYFALDYNATDGLLYGYTEYGSPDGLHSIDVRTGVITPIAGSIPASNSAARGMACGYNKVYLVSVYGNENVPMFVYDLAQGHGGTWVPFTHPFPESNSTSGAAWIPGPKPGDLNCDGRVTFDDINPFVLALSDPAGYTQAYPDCTIYNGDVNLDGHVNFDDINPFVALLTGGAR